MKKYLVTPLVIFTVSCAEKSITIAEIEEAGFKKDAQQIYQAVGAVDGWSGNLAEDRVELYQYESPRTVKKDFFSDITTDGNISGWTELCVHKNIVLISKGNSACPKLKTL